MAQFTRVTCATIPGYPHVRIREEAVERNTTWNMFLRRHNVKLDPAYFIVYNKTRRLHSALNEPISLLMNNFRRKATITVIVVKLETPNPAVVSPRNGQQNGTRRLSFPNSARSRFPEDEIHLGEGAEENAGPAGVRIENDDDAMSMLSQDDEDDETAAVIKRQFQMAVDRLPASHFKIFKEELMQLKSGEGRDYKWSHYAPRTSNFVFSSFKL